MARTRAYSRSIKYFHASPERYQIGKVIAGIALEGIYLTTSPVPHFTIIDRAVKHNYTVYQVEPLTKIHTGDWDDLWTKQVRIIKRVGSARGIAKRNPTGSRANPKPARSRTLCVLHRHAIKDPRWGGV